MKVLIMIENSHFLTASYTPHRQPLGTMTAFLVEQFVILTTDHVYSHTLYPHTLQILPFLADKVALSRGFEKSSTVKLK